MAEYITANRWITGVATHKTKRGRILCTGLGCVGCFPEDYPEIACELEVYDSKTGLLFSESCTNDHNKDSAIETRSNKINPLKQNNGSKINYSRYEIKRETDTSDRTAQENIESSEFEKLFLTEYEETNEANKTKSFVPTEKLPIAKGDNSCKETDIPSSTEKLKNHDSFCVHRRVVYHEDCVCLLFALECYEKSRRLSGFSILEIVGSLTTIMHVNEIKYVQRLHGLWHIVLRTREHLSLLLENGLKIRGRWYKLILDINMYCEKEY